MILLILVWKIWNAVLKIFIETNDLNWIKYNFMVTKEIVLGLKTSSKGNEIDQDKI